MTHSYKHDLNSNKQVKRKVVKNKCRVCGKETANIFRCDTCLSGIEDEEEYCIGGCRDSYPTV